MKSSALFHTLLDRPFFVTSLVFFAFASIFVASASRDEAPSVDVATNATSAFLWAKTGSPFFPELQQVVDDPDSAGLVTWFVDSPDGPVSLYPPGTALLAAPLYLLVDGELEVERLTERTHGVDGSLLVPDMWPAATTAALATAAAMSLLFSTLVATGHSLRTSLYAVAIVGFGTGVWTVAADSLWQHGPALLAIGVAMRASVSRSNLVLAVACFSAVAIRAPVAAITVAIGLGASLDSRQGRSLGSALAGTVLGGLALLTYNSLVFGEIGLTSGYGSYFVANLLSPDIPALLGTFWDVLFSRDRGVVMWSPFLGLSLLALPVVWRQTPIWIKAAAVGAAVYLVVQYVAVQDTPFRYTGGRGFSYYRFPLEAIYALVPVGVSATQRFLRSGRVAVLGYTLAVAFAGIAHGVAALDLK